MIDIRLPLVHFGIVSRPQRTPKSLFIVLALSFFTFPGISPASISTPAYKQKASYDMRQATIAFATYTLSGPRIRYNPDSFQTMEDFIRILAQKVDLNDAGIFLSYYDTLHFNREAPKITGIRRKSGDFEFQPEILDFPIAFSVAVYPDLSGPTPRTPLLWTRGLHNYKHFEEPYGGHIAYMDGHVTYYVGKPGEPNPELDAIFGPDSEFSKAIRILEHEPDGWSSGELAPLPVRYQLPTKVGLIRSIAPFAALCIPAFIAAFLVALFPKPSMSKRLTSASIAFGIVLITTLILVPSC